MGDDQMIMHRHAHELPGLDELTRDADVFARRLEIAWGRGRARCSSELTSCPSCFTVSSVSHLNIIPMSFLQDDGLHLIRLGDRIIGLDRVDYVKYKAREETPTGNRPARLEIYFGSSGEPLTLTDSETSSFFNILNSLVLDIKVEPS